ncbi:MAG: amino acid ABC transporter permease, partial [Eubacteriales bacterium]|nr:amino acid ABC transporter permease [Eubacteriales bacterium]
LLKETSVATVIAMQELTYGGNIIRSRTYNPFLPLLTVAFMYWVVVTVLTALVGRLESRLRKNEKR